MILLHPEIFLTNTSIEFLSVPPWEKLDNKAYPGYRRPSSSITEYIYLPSYSRRWLPTFFLYLVNDFCKQSLFLFCYSYGDGRRLSDVFYYTAHRERIQLKKYYQPDEGISVLSLAFPNSPLIRIPPTVDVEDWTYGWNFPFPGRITPRIAGRGGGVRVDNFRFAPDEMRDYEQGAVLYVEL